MVGESDNLTVPQMLELLAKQKISQVSDITSSESVETFQDALRKSNFGTQQIRSQIILSDPEDLYQVPPPSTFQLFGQRFAIDSFVLSKVVYDSIIYHGKKVKRYVPCGADVMFALGNEAALPILETDMTRLPYASNLQASREFVGQFQPPYWRRNLYNIWLDSLRTLSADPSSEKHLPEAMRTEAWQLKQLQTQLASWSELRHNTVLYAKQSYTSNALCEYPTGYVEPYPETYAKIKFFASASAGSCQSAPSPLQRIDAQSARRVTDGLHRFNRATAHEHRQPPEQRPLCLVQQVIAPLDRAAQCPLPRGKSAAPPTRCAAAHSVAQATPAGSARAPGPPPAQWPAASLLVLHAYGRYNRRIFLRQVELGSSAPALCRKRITASY